MNSNNYSGQIVNGLVVIAIFLGIILIVGGCVVVPKIDKTIATLGEIRAGLAEIRDVQLRPDPAAPSLRPQFAQCNSPKFGKSDDHWNGAKGTSPAQWLTEGTHCAIIFKQEVKLNFLTNAVEVIVDGKKVPKVSDGTWYAAKGTTFEFTFIAEKNQLEYVPSSP